MTECVYADITVLNYIPILMDVILNVRVGWVVFSGHYWDICLFLSIDFQKVKHRLLLDILSACS